MIDAYVWTTPNGFKLLIALEELALPHRLHWIDISKGEQKTPAYLAINPNNKIPALVDHTEAGDITVFESAVVLQYLGDKTGQLLPAAGPARYATLSWLVFGAANTGPMGGQLYAFTKAMPEKWEPAIKRFTDENHRIFGVMDRRLGEARYLGGDAYSIADIMNITWVKATIANGIAVDTYPHLARWKDEVLGRDAVQRALAMKP